MSQLPKTDSENKLKVRHHDLDALRSFAMLLGIALHGIMSFNGMNFWPGQDMNQNPKYGVIFEFIHGFRMQLFFLVSGFFTSMMLLKRGSFSVSIQRVKRILVPLILSIIILAPLMNNMGKLNEWKKEINEKDVPEKRSEIKGSSIWAAAKRNDLNLLNSKISEGFDVNKKDFMQATPLHWAAAYGNNKSIEILLSNGANINSTDGKGSTPLHWASFMARPITIELLILKGADPSKKNIDGSTSFDSAELDQGTMKFILGALRIDEDLDLIMDRRIDARAALSGKKLNFITKIPAKINDFINKNYFINFFGNKQIILHHMWFLYFLFVIGIAFCLIFKIFDLVYPFKNWSNLPPYITISIRLTLVCVLIFLTYQTQLKMGSNEFGPATAIFFKPDKLIDIFVLNGFDGKPAWWILAHYFLFFTCGALMYGFRNFGIISKFIWPLLFFTGFVFLIIALREFNKPCPDWLNLRKDLSGPFAFLNESINSIYEWIKTFNNPKPLVTTIYCWAMIFGFIGFFKFFFSKGRPMVRYISDSSYWLYLGHQPLVQAYQILLSDWDIEIYVKFPLICFITALTLIIIYHYFIRYTFIGTLLNGPRKKVQAT